MLLAISAAGLVAAATGRDPEVTAWPRPFDPAKPFDFLGVPGVTPEQRDRAADLLVRSLEEAPRWANYQAAIDAGWYSFGDNKLGFEHLFNPDMFYDGAFLDPTAPESLLYKVRGKERIFAAYMFIADPTVAPDDPRLTGFAGRLIEWHTHNDICLTFSEEYPAGKVAGRANPDGSCSAEGASTRTRDPRSRYAPPGQVEDLPLSAYAMTHVWVVERVCGPFSALEGFFRGVTLTPAEERTDICEH
jgi:hypothetical protein